MTEEEWGPWIEHDGKGCPKEVIGNYIQEVGVWKDHMRGTEGRVMSPGPDWDWSNHPINWMVIRYRIRKPRALQQLREIAKNVREGVDA